jgi:hypothetical protein
MFVMMSQLKDQVHCADAEVLVIEDAAVKAFKRVRQAIGGSICSAAVDNAAVPVTDAVIEKYAEECLLRTRGEASLVNQDNRIQHHLRR